MYIYIAIRPTATSYSYLEHSESLQNGCGVVLVALVVVSHEVVK